MTERGSLGHEPVRLELVTDREVLAVRLRIFGFDSNLAEPILSAGTRNRGCLYLSGLLEEDENKVVYSLLDFVSEKDGKRTTDARVLLSEKRIVVEICSDGQKRIHQLPGLSSCEFNGKSLIFKYSKNGLERSSTWTLPHP